MEKTRELTDREMLLFVYGAIKATQVVKQDMIVAVEKHLFGYDRPQKLPEEK